MARIVTRLVRPIAVVAIVTGAAAMVARGSAPRPMTVADATPGVDDARGASARDPALADALAAWRDELAPGAAVTLEETLWIWRSADPACSPPADREAALTTRWRVERDPHGLLRFERRVIAARGTLAAMAGVVEQATQLADGWRMARGRGDGRLATLTLHETVPTELLRESVAEALGVWVCEIPGPMAADEIMTSAATDPLRPFDRVGASTLLPGWMLRVGLAPVGRSLRVTEFELAASSRPSGDRGAGRRRTALSRDASGRLETAIVERSTRLGPDEWAHNRHAMRILVEVPVWAPLRPGVGTLVTDLRVGIDYRVGGCWIALGGRMIALERAIEGELDRESLLRLVGAGVPLDRIAIGAMAEARDEQGGHP